MHYSVEFYVFSLPLSFMGKKWRAVTLQPKQQRRQLIQLKPLTDDAHLLKFHFILHDIVIIKLVLL